MTERADIIICGAGIAGISAAYFLLQKNRQRKIVLVDERPPLSLTSDKSTECYRNWWPGPGSAMTDLMNRSVLLLQEIAEKSNNLFLLNQRGYLYATASEQEANAMRLEAEQISALGAGPLRSHHSSLSDYPDAHAEGYFPSLDGADWIDRPDLILSLFPYLNPDVRAALHVRRAGWFSAQQLGMYMLDQCRQKGLTLIKDRVTGITQAGERATGVTLAGGQSISCGSLIIAGGPFTKELTDGMGIDLPLINELHMKASIRDPHVVIPRSAPLIIWKDRQSINWTSEEQAFLAADPESAYLTREMNGGCHTRPEGGPGSQILLLLWEYHTNTSSQPQIPPVLDNFYPEIALRGMSTAIPGLSRYIGKLTRPWIDGGYYTRTPENRPLIGPLPVSGTFISGAYSGYGLMAACGAGELCAAHVDGDALPPYSSAFALARYQDPAYNRMIESMSNTGQL